MAGAGMKRKRSPLDKAIDRAWRDHVKALRRTLKMLNAANRAYGRDFKAKP